MSNSLRLGFKRYLVPVPRPIWQGEISKTSQAAIKNLAFMTTDHHRIRDFVVREMPRYGHPIPPAYIAEKLDIPLARIQVILDELEKQMTFLFRNVQGEVVWAYPVTVADTPHRITFNTGEQVNAA